MRDEEIGCLTCDEWKEYMAWRSERKRGKAASIVDWMKWREQTPEYQQKLADARTLKEQIESERQKIVDTLADERAKLLRSTGNYPDGLVEDLEGGRLLICFGPTESVWDGASEVESRGFFDEYDIPPWDSWLCWTRETPEESQVRRQEFSRLRTTFLPDRALDWERSYLISWVPPQLIEVATSGIEVNPVDCIHFAHVEDTIFTRQLCEAGWLG